MKTQHKLTHTVKLEPSGLDGNDKLAFAVAILGIAFPLALETYAILVAMKEVLK